MRKSHQKRGRRAPVRRSARINNVTKRATDRPHPLPVTVDLTASRLHEVVVTWTGPITSTTASSVTVKQLVDAIPGGSDLWDRVQFHRFDVYGAQLKQTGGESGPSYSSSAWPWLQVNLRNDLNGSYFGDVASFYDDAVGNSRRSHVGIVPNDLFRSAWFASNLASPILEFSTDAKDTEAAISANIYEVLVQYSCSLRSTPGVTFEPVTAEVTPVQNRHHQ